MKRQDKKKESETELFTEMSATSGNYEEIEFENIPKIMNILKMITNRL